MLELDAGCPSGMTFILSRYAQQRNRSGSLKEPLEDKTRMPLRDDMGEWGDMKTFVIVSLRSTRQLKWIPGSRPEDDNYILEAANKNHLSVSKGEVRDRHSHCVALQ